MEWACGSGICAMDTFDMFFLQLLLLTVSESSPVTVVDGDRKSLTAVATGTHIVQAQHNALFKAEGCGG